VQWGLGSPQEIVAKPSELEKREYQERCGE
jgi:hypothetical protein